MVAGAAVGEGLQGVGHLPQLVDPFFEISDVRLGQALDVGAAARAVVPQVQQVADLGDRKAQVAGAANKAQLIDVSLRVDTIIGGGARRCGPRENELL